MLIAFSVMISVALLSYDRNDLSFNNSSPNHPTHNLIGSVGAYSAYGLFLLFGAGAYLVPVLLTGFGLAGILEFLAYLQRRTLWAVLLILACMGMLDLYSNTLNLAINKDSASAGGLIGMGMNNLIFNHFGRVGATIVFATIYLVDQFSTRRLDARPLAAQEGSGGESR
jgi:S-DNA-T family DNA segregation ATPase FtsK/SpoIIIE